MQDHHTNRSLVMPDAIGNPWCWKWLAHTHMPVQQPCDLPVVVNFKNPRLSPKLNARNCTRSNDRPV